MELADRKPFFEEGVQKLQNEGYRNFGEEFYRGLSAQNGWASSLFLKVRTDTGDSLHVY
jgi:hypothetical protein